MFRVFWRVYEVWGGVYWGRERRGFLGVVLVFRGEERKWRVEEDI